MLCMATIAAHPARGNPDLPGEMAGDLRGDTHPTGVSRDIAAGKGRLAAGDWRPEQKGHVALHR
jgi:hypothetical protein